MSRYQFVPCLPTGEPLGEALTASKRNLTKQRNGVHQATLVLPMDDAISGRIQPGFSRLKVWRERSAAELAAGLSGNVLTFYGHLPSQGLKLSPSGESMECSFLDPRWVLSRRYNLGTETFTATDQGDILWGLVATQNARTGGDTWIRQGGTTTGVIRDRIVEYSDRQLVSQLVSQMTQLIDGCDVDVDPVDGWGTGLGRVMGNLRCYLSQGADKPNMTFEYGVDTLANCAAVEVEWDEVTTLATVTGTADQSETPVVGTYGSPDASSLGLLEEYASDSDVSTQTTVDQKARGVVLAKQGLRPIFTVHGPTSDAPRAFEQYDIGDTVRVTVKKGAWSFASVPVRVDGINLDISQEGVETPTLTLAGA
ncbi:MAG: hypothetical protein H0X39_18610 [Actinobacteria bacterium]|nr:hypothetical protein [Actinomycetota bacterium]